MTHEPLTKHEPDPELTGHTKQAEEESVPPLCTRNPNLAGCRSAEEREAIIRDFGTNISTVSSTYRDAIAIIQTEALIAKEEDLPFIASLVLELGSMFVVGALGKAAAKVLAPRVKSVFTEVALTCSMSFKQKKSADAITNAIGEKLLEKAKGKIATGAAAEHATAEPNERVDNVKAGQVAYLSVLYNAAAQSFAFLQRDLPRHSTDDELRAYRRAFDPALHDIEKYKAAIRQKLGEFNRSGVTKIGRKHAERFDGTEFGNATFGTVKVVRDTRVAWHKYKSGFPRQLVYEHVDTDRSAWLLDQFEAKKDRMIAGELGHLGFGARSGALGHIEAGSVVPEAFHEMAIAQHMEAWGGVPPVIEIDDTKWMDPSRTSVAAMHRRASNQ